MLRTFGTWPGSYDAFVERFCTTRHTPYGPAITGHKDIPGFRALMAPLMLRRKKADVMPQLPAITLSDYFVAAGPVDYEISFAEYFVTNRMKVLESKLQEGRDLLGNVIKIVGTGQDGITMLAAMGDSVSTLRRHNGLQKVAPVIETVKTELESGLDKIVLFAIHKAVIEGLREGLSKYGAVTVYGKTPPEKKQRNIDKFARDPRCRVFIGNIQAAGVAINGLQAQCCNVMMVEQDWVPGNNAQAVMRVHRIGQNRPVLVRHVMIEGDEQDIRVAQVLRRKTKDLILAFD